MFLADGRIIYSASDLAAAARCEYALLRNLDARLGRGPAQPGTDELLERTAALGDEHEHRHLEELRAEYGTDIAVIGRPAYTVAGLTAAAAATRSAVARRAPVIYQAAMFDGRFAGFADFLVLQQDRYLLRDTKLARSVKVEALLQLAAYADALHADGVPVAGAAELVLGDGAVGRYRVDELLPVYRRRRRALQSLLDSHLAASAPVDWADEGVGACFRCPQCTEQVRAHDDLLLVAGMRVSQRARLIDAGITTVHRLAAQAGPVPELSARAVRTLAAQARLQTTPHAGTAPPYEVVDAEALAVLPNPDRGDLFFDFEGDPLWTADGREWGLEYLWGVLGADADFQPIWAHDRPGERAALQRFLALVAKRRKRHPGMHIYHYAAYEKSALLRLAGRYGLGEAAVDELLRSGVLVDLYPLVRKSIRVGTENYSLKSLEPLYMGAELRDGEVTKATDSITEYARYCAQRDAGNDAQAAATLKEIEDYNRYDCRSTHKLRNWLLNRAFEAGVVPRGPRPVTPGDTAAPPDALDTALMAFATAAGGQRSAEQAAVALVAAARGFYRREAKPYWWAHFDRLNNPVDEWADTTDVLLAEHTEVVDDWCIPPRAKKPRRRLRLSGEVPAGTPEGAMFALYTAPAPVGMSTDPDRAAASSVEVVDVDDPEAPTAVVVDERLPTGCAPYPQTPFALTPGPPIPTKAQQNSVDGTAADLAAHLPQLPRTAIMDLLARRPPRTRSGAPLPRTGDTAADITAALLDLDSSYLAVHGPPGTGKTFTAARVITRLVNEHGWRVGVAAQAHAVVENLFADVIKAGVSAAQVAKKPNGRPGSGAGWRELDNTGFAPFLTGHADPGTGCVIGGTAWDFANPGRIAPGGLDLLVIEEAGQYSLANTIAVAPAAANLLLLGDPQQLPQVSQGFHPEPVDDSALGWLVDGRHTLPLERGYFLDRSFRMHPAVCGPVSRLSYDGRLFSRQEVAGARILAGCEPGVHLLEVSHTGNATDSAEEAAAITAQIGLLLGAAWTDEHGTRPLGPADVLVVTPYNAQVGRVRRHLEAAGLGSVQVGTVDRFQGRQAPVVFVSMTASSVEEVPRGMSFLLNRNRLNVAISRAKYRAVVVHSPALTDHLPSTPAGLADLGAFLALGDQPDCECLP